MGSSSKFSRIFFGGDLQIRILVLLLLLGLVLEHAGSIPLTRQYDELLEITNMAEEAADDNGEEIEGLFNFFF